MYNINLSILFFYLVLPFFSPSIFSIYSPISLFVSLFLTLLSSFYHLVLNQEYTNIRKKTRKREGKISSKIKPIREVNLETMRQKFQINFSKGETLSRKM
ncbi:hypothetical protein PanWU01x14_264170 [Parasponia andersonii]|uniref:Transmembrane protein n=1 Tax=Parasponia andersonii TaxID=3476 RepID=A0A2P5B7Q3_PARAD|nr:hypothetical protein PanWU01x14_264170 [Parasponia andersonii]